ncbi:hypothetical protein C8J56DRAFT_1057406 [Mycena floridula]|nr:hypothetical protein C8J56DRAFT_1057406 [Mycena floridula]
MVLWNLNATVLEANEAKDPIATIQSSAHEAIRHPYRGHSEWKALQKERKRKSGCSCNVRVYRGTDDLVYQEPDFTRDFFLIIIMSLGISTFLICSFRPLALCWLLDQLCSI